MHHLFSCLRVLPNSCRKQQVQGTDVRKTSDSTVNGLQESGWCVQSHKAGQVVEDGDRKSGESVTLQIPVMEGSAGQRNNAAG